ncbi:MAG: hypothetical protein QME52_05215 [Bacteroidota bacterium]|nr:hypothetical protein [Bacteroidota bacterium]
MKLISFSVGFISAAIIAYQLSLMRVLSFIQWYHFAFMIISIALLGFGTSGVILAIFREKLLNRFYLSFSVSLLACSIFMILSPQLVRSIHFEPYLIILDFGQIWSLLFVCGLLFIPFVCGACAIGLALMKYSEKVHQIYFANLFGSAIGGILAIGMMFIFHPLKLIPTVSLIAFLSAAFICNRTEEIAHDAAKSHKKICYTLLCINLIMIVLTFSIFPIELKMSEYKSLSKTQMLPDAKIIKEKISLMGVVNVLESSALRYAPSLSLNYMGDIPSPLGVFIDGEWTGAIFKKGKTTAISFLDFTTSTLPYRLKPKSDVLVIGAGTGTEIQIAIQQEASNIEGIELNPQIIELIRKDFAEIAGDLYSNYTAGIAEYPQVNIFSGEARSYLTQTEKKFDVISIPLMEGFTASAAGMHSLFENYLFTTESFGLMFDRLTDNGILAITTWINHPPRHAMKLLTMLIETLRQNNIEHPDEHFAGVRSWGTATFLLKKNKFTEKEIVLLKQFYSEYSFDPIYYPTISTDEVNRFNQLEQDYFYNAATNIFNGKADSIYKHYIFNIEPATDNQPYYSHFLKLSNIPYFIEMLGRDALPLMDWGYLVLLSTLIALVFLSVIFIILPLFALRQSDNDKGNKLRTFLYFSGLGIGFMFIEIVMIQKFILFLGHPMYSVSAIITGILLFSGLGSLSSHRLNAGKNIKIIVGLILILGVSYGLLLNDLFQLMLHFPMGLKYISALLIISPLAFFMGMPFPTGLAALSRISSSLVPWAWGVNGFMSVISAVLATFIAIEFGFMIVFAVAIISYGVVLIAGTRLIQPCKKFSS